MLMLVLVLVLVPVMLLTRPLTPNPSPLSTGARGVSGALGFVFGFGCGMVWALVVGVIEAVGVLAGWLLVCCCLDALVSLVEIGFELGRG